MQKNRRKISWKTVKIPQNPEESQLEVGEMARNLDRKEKSH